MTVSDHKCIVINSEPPVIIIVISCSLCNHVFNEKSISKTCALLDSVNRQLPEYSHTNNLADHFNSICLSSLNIIAPLTVRCKSSERKQPLINNNIHSCLRECRRTERRWKKSGVQAHNNIFKELCLHYNNIVKNA